MITPSIRIQQRLRRHGISATLADPKNAAYYSDIHVPTQYGLVLVYLEHDGVWKATFPVVPEPNEAWRMFVASIQDIVRGRTP